MRLVPFTSELPMCLAGRELGGIEKGSGGSYGFVNTAAASCQKFSKQMSDNM